MLRLRGRLSLLPSRALHLAAAALLLAAACPIASQQQSSPSPTCNCDDLARLKDRLEKLEGIQKLVAHRLQSTATNAPATQADWASLQASINSFLRAMQVQSLTQFPDTSLFPGPDPACSLLGAQPASCIEGVEAIHQSRHAESCNAGLWNWQTPWLATAMLQQEAAAIQAEIDTLKRLIDELHCMPCPIFTVKVQVITTTAYAGSGLREQSGRSLNNGQGITIPLAMQSDGSFQGAASGIDAGAAFGSSPAESVGGQFGHIQAIFASGNIQHGVCTSQPCGRDILHLTLIGGSSTQVEQMQARGAVNRDINRSTSTGGATLVFDIPAYVGESAERTFIANAIINSRMTVVLGQAGSGSVSLPAGSSMLFSMQQCEKSRDVAVGSNPSKNGPGTGGGSGPRSGGSGSSGGTGPGGGGGTGSAPGQSPIRLRIDEPVHLADSFSSPSGLDLAEKISVRDSVQLGTDISFRLDESIQVADTPEWPVALDLSEKIKVNDAALSVLPLPVRIDETITVADSLPAEVVLNIAEKVNVIDSVVTTP